MKIVTRAELLTLPPGTLYTEAYSPGNYGPPTILGSPFSENDFTCRDLGPAAHDPDDEDARTTAMWQDGASFPVNEDYGRDGLFDDGARYLVYEPADVASIIAAITPQPACIHGSLRGSDTSGEYRWHCELCGRTATVPADASIDDIHAALNQETRTDG